MTTEEFVLSFYREKQSLLAHYLLAPAGATVPPLFKDLQLSEQQLEGMREVLDTVLTDVFYSTLLGLEGSGSIGRIQT
jgi:hypothetical protein